MSRQPHGPGICICSLHLRNEHCLEFVPWTVNFPVILLLAIKNSNSILPTEGVFIFTALYHQGPALSHVGRVQKGNRRLISLKCNEPRCWWQLRTKDWPSRCIQEVHGPESNTFTLVLCASFLNKQWGNGSQRICRENSLVLNNFPAYVFTDIFSWKRSIRMFLTMLSKKNEKKIFGLGLESLGLSFPGDYCPSWNVLYVNWC